MEISDADNLLRLLEDTSRGLGIEVRHEHLSSEAEDYGTKGGFCRVHGRRYIFVDRKLGPLEKCTILAEALSEMDLSKVFVPPAVRRALENVVKAR